MAAQPAVSAEDVRSALDRIAASAPFRGAGRLGDLLRYVVEAALKAPGAALKEYQIGAEALGRGDKFDPRYDPIVRSEMSRLRTRLAQYYSSEGAADPVRIDIPKGGYAPVFTLAPASEQSPAKPASRRRDIILWTAIGVAALSLTAAAYAVLAPRPSPPASVSHTLEAALGAPGQPDNVLLNPIDLSPDGKTLVMAMRGADMANRLFSRDLNSLEAHELPGTAGGFGPMFSPDGQWVAFNTIGKLKKTRIDGAGSPVVITDQPELIGGAWLRSGLIVGTSLRRSVLVSVPETGGPLSTWLDVSSSGDALLWLSALPGGRGLLAQAVSATTGQSRIEAISTDKKRKTIIETGAYPRYAAGNLFYVDRGALFAVKFDPDRLEKVGAPKVIADNIGFSLSGGATSLGAAWYDVSEDGSLVFIRNAKPALRIIALLGENGSMKPLTASPGEYVTPRLSPDGKRIAYGVVEGQQTRLETLNLSTGVRLRLTPPDMSEANPVWSRDGKYLFFSQPNGEMARLVWRDADASGGEAHLLLSNGEGPALTGDGLRMVFGNMRDPKTHFDVWTAPVTYGPDGPKAGEPQPVLEAPGLDLYPGASPDGKWVVFVSTEGDGDPYIYAATLAPGGHAAKIKISSSTGGPAIWSPTRKEIFYHSAPDATLMVQPLTIKDGALAAQGSPHRWTTRKIPQHGMAANFDISPDGRSVVAVLAADEETPREYRMIVVTNVTSRTGPPL